MVPRLTGAAWASLGRVAERRKRGEPEPSPEEVAERYAPSVSNRQVGACSELTANGRSASAACRLIQSLAMDVVRRAPLVKRSD
jgi:hypothetical protein